MKKLLSISLLLVLTATLLLTGCIRGQKAVQSIEIIEGFKYQYELNETPDFSNVKARIIYNDGTSKDVTASDLEFGKLDTSVAGKKSVTVSYGDFSTSFSVEVKAKAIESIVRELVSIEYYSGLPKVIYVNDTFYYEPLVIKANYSDNTSSTIKLSDNANIKHSEIDTSKAGTQQLTFTYMGKTATVDVVISEVVLTEIEVDANSIPVTTEGTAFDPTGLVVYAIYNNNTTGIKIPVNQLEIVESNGKVTISYQGVSTEITVIYTDPVVESLTITGTGYAETDNTIIIGDELHTDAVTVKAKLNNGGTRNLSASEFTVTHGEVKEGTVTLTVTYNADSNIKATVDITVLGIVSVKIDRSTVKDEIKEGDTLNVSGLKVFVMCTDGKEYTRSAGVVVNTNNLDTSYPNKDTSYITASYGGVESEKLYIMVLDKNLAYFIMDVAQPNQFTESGTNARKEGFINKTYGYVVGDDNPFIYKLLLTILDENDNLVENYDEYISYFELWYEGAQLTGDDLAKYASFLPERNAVQFTQEAVGKTFTIKTRPRDGVDNVEEQMTKSITVTVVDGYNIYEAWELNYLTNHNDFDFSYVIAGETRTQVQIVNDFLATKLGLENGDAAAAARPQNLAGIVLHGNLVIEKDDIPNEYYFDKSRTSIYDTLTVFPHANDSTAVDEEGRRAFSFYGNHFTVFSYNIPNVNEEKADGKDNVSNGQLFRFTITNDALKYDGSYDHTLYATYLYNWFLKDNEPNSDNMANANRDMMGLIGMKVNYQMVFVENIHVEAFYISFFPDKDYLTVNINESVFYNSWQNHIFIYSDNKLQGANDTPREDYPVATINITNSSITKCGGPVIISMTADTSNPSQAKSGAIVNIDENTEIWTYVTGQEAWFKAMGQTSNADLIVGIAQLYEAQYGKGFTTLLGENNTSSDLPLINIVLVNVAGIGLSGDVDGTCTIGGTKYLDMTDTAIIGATEAGLVYGQYGNPYVAGAAAQTGGAAPIIETTDGVTLFNGSSWQTVAGTHTQGDYLTLYFGGMGIVLGYDVNNHRVATPSIVE